MAAATEFRPSFACACFFTGNIFIPKYGTHVTYLNRSHFMEHYAKILRNNGCVTDKQFEEVIQLVEKEVTRRKQLGEACLRRQAEIKMNYKPRHKEIYQLKEDYLHKEFLSIVQKSKLITTVDTNVQSLLEMMRVLDDGIFQFPVFAEDFCRLFLEEMEHIEKSGCCKGRPNTMNNYGVLLEEFGFNEGLLTPLREAYLTPVTSLLFPAFGGTSLDSHKAFTVEYSDGTDTRLSWHFDNAEISLNVCLGGDFTHGALAFAPNSDSVDGSCSDAHFSGSSDDVTCTQMPSWGVLHCGRRKHCARTTHGRRCNLVMWLRSSRVRDQQCPMCSQAPRPVAVPGLDDGFSAPAVETCQML